MRLALQEDVENLKVMFEESTVHANQVGHIDRPDKFDDQYLTPLIETKELFCFEVSDRIVGAARLTDIEPSPAIWEDLEAKYLYIGRLASGNLVRNSDFFQKVMLIEITDEAKKRDKRGLRLSCLADNQRLIDFYSRIGFSNIGKSQIFSSFYEKQIYVTKFELGVVFDLR